MAGLRSLKVLSDKACIGTLKVLLVVLFLCPILGILVQAQTFSVLHTFTGRTDGSNPSGGGLTSDSAGNLYGTTAYGGVYSPNCVVDGQQSGCGTVYKMSRRGSEWTLNVLYSFAADGDGFTPDQVVSIASDGSLYGSTYYGPGAGCTGNGCGTVFRLQPQPTICRTTSCPWIESVLHRFQGYPSEGSQPAFGHVTLDAAGNVYGTTAWGGGAVYYAGNVYELTRSGNSWTESALYNFTGGYDGDASWSGVVFDSAGDLYGTTTYGGALGFGAIFKLTRTESGWTESVLHSFRDSTDGGHPSGAVVMDAAGNLYGGAGDDGPNGGGTVWELSPANGSWNFSVLHAFSGSNIGGPNGGLSMDQAGNLYGATFEDGAHGHGNVFKLTPTNGGWTYTSLYDFTGGSDGSWPNSRLVVDANGNLFGTTESGGQNDNGVLFEITP